MIGPTYMIDWIKEDIKPLVMLVHDDIAYVADCSKEFHSYYSLADFIFGGYVNNSAVIKMVLPRSGYFNFFLKIIVQKIVSLVKHLYPRTSFSDKILDTGYSWP